MRSAAVLLVKRLRIAPGSCFSSTGGMKSARFNCQNGVLVKASRHHSRQRATVRRSTPSSLVRQAIRLSVMPWFIIEISTTTTDR